jgi:hypothetical protein
MSKRNEEDLGVLDLCEIAHARFHARRLGEPTTLQFDRQIEMQIETLIGAIAQVYQTYPRSRFVSIEEASRVAKAS